MATGSDKRDHDLQNASGRLVGYAKVDELRHEERRTLVRKIAISLVAIAVLSCVSCLFISGVYTNVNTNDTYVGYIVTPASAFALIQQVLHDITPIVPAPQQFVNILATNNVNASTGIVDFAGDEEHFFIFLAGLEADRLCTTALTIGGGVLLALSGMLYQNVFRNPIATPTMLGVQSGVNLGNLLMVMLFGQLALEMVVPRYLLCYGCGIAMLLLVILGGKFISGKRPFNVVDLLLVGTAMGSIVGVLIQYLPANWDDTTWQIYYALSEVTAGDTSLPSLISMAAIIVIAVVPVFLLRWKMNALSFENVEVRLLGIDPSRLRMLALVCGSLMILVAMVTVGSVGMAAIIVPFVARYWFGSEARQQFWGNVMLGPIVLLLCRLLCNLGQTLFPILGTSLSMGTVVSILVLPVFLWVVSTHQRGWE